MIRQGDLFFKQFNIDNSALAVGTSLKVTGVKNNVGPNGEDAVTELDRLAFTPKTPEIFIYDADGNLTADGHWTYAWDGENRLTAIETSAAAVSAGAPKQKIEFAYDGQSRRISKKVYTWSGTAWTLDSSLLFLYDGWNMIAELDALATNAPVRTYVWGVDLSGSLQGAGGVGGLLFTNLGGATHASAFDGTGNVVALTDMGNGARSAEFEYDPFGNFIKADGVAAQACPFGFSTHYLDQETGLSYAKNRFIKDDRFLNRDPAEESAGGPNLYAMVSNDPVNRIDPLGLWETDAHHEMVNNLFSVEHSKSFGCCSINLASAMKDGSDEVDGAGDHKRRFLDAQSEALAYQHAMMAPNENVNLARGRYERFVAEKIELAKVEAAYARKNNDCKLMSRAFANLGMAFHAFSDSLSPSHHGFQVWYGPQHALGGQGNFIRYSDYVRDHHNQETVTVYHNLQIGVDTAIRSKFGNIINEMLGK